MNAVDFEFSDTIAGYITGFDREKDIFTLKTSDDREYSVKFSSNAYAWIINNLNHPRRWCGEQMRDMLDIGRHLFVYAVFYPETRGYAVEAQYLIFSGTKPGHFPFEKQDWWGNQIQALGEFYLKAQFGDEEINYDNYRTTITLDGKKEQDLRHYRFGYVGH